MASTRDEAFEEAERRWQAGDDFAEPKLNGHAGEDDEFTREAHRLAQLPPHEYDKERKAKAKRLDVRTATLDAAVDAIRNAARADEAGGKGKTLELPEPEPWQEPVEGGALLVAINAQIQRFVILSDHAAVAASLWTVHTHAHDAAFISPRFTAVSPTKRCGKSSLFRILARMARRALSTSNISPSAMFRVIEAASPTLFCDEMSSIGDKERATELRGVVNSSHCRADAIVIRNVPVADGYEPRAFSTWAPMALAYIKHVDDQIRDRSIIVSMERKPPGQSVEQLRLDHDQGFGELARKAARWASDNLEALRRADPAVPSGLNDRAADNWRPLLAVADRAGGNWPERARAAAAALSVDEGDDAIGVELLCDLQKMFSALNVDRLASEDIVAHLIALEGRPWAEFGRAAKPITKHQLARLLKPFKIVPMTVRPDGAESTARGYKRESFLDLWNRYFQNDTTTQATESASFSDFQNDTSDSDVSFRNQPKAAATASCVVVSFQNPPNSVETSFSCCGVNGHAERRHIGSCEYCRDVAYEDDAGALDSAAGTVLHYRCTMLWRSVRPLAENSSPEIPPAPGAVQEGYRFIGGDPAVPRNWEPLP